VHLDDGYCGATAVEIDPEDGCLTYTEDTLDGELFLDDDGEGDYEDDDSWDDAGFEELEDLDEDFDEDEVEDEEE